MNSPVRLSKYEAAVALIREIDLHNTLMYAGKEITHSDAARMVTLVKQYYAAYPSWPVIKRRIPKQRKPLK